MSTVPSSPGEAAQQRQAFQPDAGKADDQPKPQKQEKHVTTYVVLSLSSDARQPSWHEAGPPVSAASAKAAIQQMLDRAEASKKEGTYVAVPERSWQPVTVKVETQTVIKFD